jgi:hypothetical protein
MQIPCGRTYQHLKSEAYTIGLVGQNILAYSISTLRIFKTYYTKTHASTAFCTRTNKYHFKVLPYGVKNGVGGFCRTMESALGHLQNCCLSYVDDLICFSPSFEQHLLDIEKVFKALAKANLKVSAQKCTWFAEELKLLGFIISGTTIGSDPKKIQAIEERESPTNVKETQIFLGCCSLY